ncbi:MAG: response regulator [Planctomycetota bacterium]
MDLEKKILVVDDDKNITNLLRQKFEKNSDFHAFMLNDPTEVMQKIRCEDFRIVLLDIDMPLKSGLELLGEIKAYDSSIQVIMITGHETLGNLTFAFQAGAEFIVLKPIVDFGELLDKVKDVTRNYAIEPCDRAIAETAFLVA